MYVHPVVYFHDDTSLSDSSFSFLEIPLLKYFMGSVSNCSNIIQPVKPLYLLHKWQVLNVHGSPMISAWSAYLDDRPEVGNSAVVRIFAVSEKHKDKTVYCQLWYHSPPTNQTYHLIVTAKHRSIGRGWKEYSEYMYTCDIPDAKVIPSYVSLVFEKCSNSTINLPIQIQEKHAHFKHKYGMCVAVAYEQIDPKRIIEWVEMNKILGVTEINIYDSNVDRESRRIFEFYEKEKIVKIFDTPPPIPNFSKWPRKLANVPILSDCMYRNMYHYKFVVVIDIDELIIPRKQWDFDAMFKAVNSYHKSQSANRAALEFRNAYFFSDLKSDETIPAALTTIRYRNHVGISKKGYSVKSITNPRECVAMMNHYCLVTLPGRSGRFSMYIEPSFGLNQHYKKCHLGKIECDAMMKTVIHDDVMLKYQDLLTKNVKLQYEKVNMRFI